ncbi:alpha/beta hydrolase [Actinomadura sp. KC216]|uniref:alpha/beta fold hydrolase n=1 Tax=Actinomadura sp. KC216 TaxID=2530370 RepID=UPI00104BFD9F|nr:alpha/beta hydrolase [Actinomadura sp. KC216]TDB85813.1 alpha/beta hydrolase [Actinomadura sp. KC216]
MDVREEDTRRAIDVAGWSFGIDTRGTGPPVILMHGLLTDSRVWDPITRVLERSHTVISVDAPGHGHSPARTSPFTLEEEADALAALAKELTNGEPAIWIGHSMGGMKAMRVALAHSSLARALVLISTQPYVEPVHSAAPFEALVETMKSDGMTRDLADVIARLNFHRSFLGTPVAQSWIEHFSTLDGHEVEHTCHAVYRRGDISERLGEITVPCLVIHGSDDVPIRVRVVHAYTELLPDVRLVELPETGHTPICEHPAKVAEIIGEFLRSLPR